mmetsp:Transcript_20418/g.48012  ORF Transcript_20418/g.48012 Transcript_20418/m.48012 type:complete len:200 (-) Transcript_20418:126-725(-)
MGWYFPLTVTKRRPIDSPPAIVWKLSSRSLSPAMRATSNASVMSHSWKIMIRFGAARTSGGRSMSEREGGPDRSAVASPSVAASALSTSLSLPLPLASSSRSTPCAVAAAWSWSVRRCRREDGGGGFDPPPSSGGSLTTMAMAAPPTRCRVLEPWWCGWIQCRPGSWSSGMVIVYSNSSWGRTSKVASSDGSTLDMCRP